MKLRVYQGLVKAGLVDSKKEALFMVEADRIRVNSVIVNSLDYFYDTKKDVLFVDGKIVKIVKKKAYILFNKPRGLETTKENILKFIDSDIKKTIFPVGRLDKDSEGLMILTNDGGLVDLLLNPAKHIEKTYLIKTEHELSDEDIHKLSSGIEIKMEEKGYYKTMPCEIRKLSSLKYEIKIYEGKKRQIRRMLEVVSNKVTELKRIAIGNILLGDLKPGKYKEISKEAIKL